MFQVAVYGKGGIGKSTISANLSVALAQKGKHVMQIGCDPKHDSTRLLIDGKTQRTVLEYVKNTPANNRHLEDLVCKGTAGVLCSEAGGPEPGIGCAGRGILTTFDTLKKLGVDELDIDFRIYDVLGDVVCGGFAVPLRSEYADAVIIVTSGEFMSLYAANNILKGLSNFDMGSPRVLGIILNCRGMEDEEEIVRKFSEAVELPILSVIPRDALFAKAESSSHTLMELFPDSMPAKSLEAIADYILQTAIGEQQLASPKPLDDDQMTDLAAGREIRSSANSHHKSISCQCVLEEQRSSISESKILGSCAAHGAVNAASRIVDAAVILHGPRSCAYLMDASRTKGILDVCDQRVFDSIPSKNLFTTNMDDNVSIFGGVDLLEQTINDAIAKKYKVIFVVTACVSGIIGDDVKRVVSMFKKSHPDLKIFLIDTSGDIAGEYTEGFLMCVDSIMSLMDLSTIPIRGYVNLVSTSFFDINMRANRKILEDLLNIFNLKLNCLFLDFCDSNSIKNFCKAEFDLPVSDTSNCYNILKRIHETTGRKCLQIPLPVGIHDFKSWIFAMGNITGMCEKAQEKVDDAERMYEEIISANRKYVQNKKLIIFNRAYRNIDWMIDLVNDLGIDLIRLGYGPTGKHDQEIRSRYSNIIMHDYTITDLRKDISNLNPDLVIGDRPQISDLECNYFRMGRVELGIEYISYFVTSLVNAFHLPVADKWKERWYS